MNTADKLTAGDLVAMIRKRYEPTAGWTVFEEARNGTGGSHVARYCDALALQTWPSRGLTAHGFEIKVDRRDVLRELRQPRKADAFQRWCDRWWLIVPGLEVIADLPLPETWGVMIAKKGRLAVHREAPELAPEPWGKPFVAALARSLTDGLVPKRELDQARHQNQVELEAKIAQALERDRLHRGGAAAELERLRQRVAEFEERAGVALAAPWAGGQHLGAAVSLLLRLINSDGRPYGLEHALRDLERLVGDLRALDAAVREVLTAPAPAARAGEDVPA